MCFLWVLLEVLQRHNPDLPPLPINGISLCFHVSTEIEISYDKFTSSQFVVDISFSIISSCRFSSKTQSNLFCLRPMILQPLMHMHWNLNIASCVLMTKKQMMHMYRNTLLCRYFGSDHCWGHLICKLHCFFLAFACWSDFSILCYINCLTLWPLWAQHAMMFNIDNFQFMSCSKTQSNMFVWGQWYCSLSCTGTSTLPHVCWWKNHAHVHERIILWILWFLSLLRFVLAFAFLSYFSILCYINCLTLWTFINSTCNDVKYW